MMYAENLLPDVTGRVIGAADKQWDAFFRNVTISGSMSGLGISLGNIQNLAADVDTVNIQSNNGQGLASVLRISNPLNATRQVMFKNGSMSIGGTNAADSLAMPISMYCEPAYAGNLLQSYRRGDVNTLLFALDAYGCLVSYATGYSPNVLQIRAVGEANPRFTLQADGSLNWGPGGNGLADAALTRTAASAMALTNAAGGNSTLDMGQLRLHTLAAVSPMVVDSSARCVNLNADFLKGTDWTNPPDIGTVARPQVYATTIHASGQVISEINDGVTPPLSIASTLPVPNLRVNGVQDVSVFGIVQPNGAGFKHARVAVGPVAASAMVLVNINWVTAFDSVNYTVAIACFDSASAGTAVYGLRVTRICQQDVNHISVVVINDDAAAAHSGSIYAIAVRG